MILNTGSRTDIVQYFSDWLLKRFEEGVVYRRNPLYPCKVTRYELSPDKIDVVLFCSKNYKPILPRLHEITDKYNTYFYYTITAYGTDIEPGVPSIDESITTLIELSKIVGKNKVAWRYDPILFTEKYGIKQHSKTFEYIARKVAPYIDRCIFSFVGMYKQLYYNMPEIIPMTENDKTNIVAVLGSVAKKYKIQIQTCATDVDYFIYGIKSSGCVTLDILGKANSIKFKKIKHKGMKKGCHCIVNRDIGAFETCQNGCRYCYANKHPEKSKENFKQHNPNANILIGEVKPTDEIVIANQQSFIKQTKNKSD